MANKVARVGQRLGLKAGDTAAILIYNEPAFIWTFLGTTTKQILIGVFCLMNCVYKSYCSI